MASTTRNPFGKDSLLVDTEDRAMAVTVLAVAGRRDKAGSDETSAAPPSAAVVARLKFEAVEVAGLAMPLLRIHFQRDSTCRPRLIQRQPGKARELQNNKRFAYEIKIVIRFFLRTRYPSHSAMTFQPQTAATNDRDL